MNLEKASTHIRQGERCGKKLVFILIDLEEGCFSLLSLIHLSNMHVLVIYSRISLNITAKVTPGCKI